jgi:hypothetical protein
MTLSQEGMDEPEFKIVDAAACKLREKLAAAAKGDNQIRS